MEEEKLERNMNKLLKYAVAIVLMLLTTFTASAQTRKAPAAKQAADAEFKALIGRYCTEWSTLNPDNPAPL